MSSYRQIADDLVARIELGQYPPGALLPSPGELAQQGYHAGAARDALRWLVRQGWAEPRPGTGYHVVQHLPAPAAEPC
jgi:DNA-binding GntR family transcriptional regulator